MGFVFALIKLSLSFINSSHQLLMGIRMNIRIMTVPCYVFFRRKLSQKNYK